MAEESTLIDQMPDGLRENLTQKQITRGGVTFDIAEIKGAEDAFDVWELIRGNLGRINLPSSEGGDFGVAGLSYALGAFDKADLKRLRAVAFANIKYQRQDVSKSWMSLDASPDAAFKGVSPLVQYELILRSVCVSFLDSSLSYVDDIGIGELVRSVTSRKDRSQSTPT